MGDARAERYLRLGLALGRHVEGLVDAYYGPPELAAAAAAGSPVAPALIAGDADALLAELDDGWLRDQVAALRACAGVLAGDALPYADEVEACYGVRPRHTPEAIFAAAHERLEELLPGPGPLAERFRCWEEALRVPADRVEELAAGVIEEARGWTRRLFGLPGGERVELEVVRDRPWLAFCHYLGDLRSRISVNVDLPISALGLLVLALHETYPGHHAEACSKQAALVRGRGLVEETIALLPTPQSLVSEGIAGLAPTLLLEGAAGPPLAAVLAGAGLELDLAHAVAVARAREPLRWAQVNAARMLHEAGAPAAEVRAYLERWALVTPELSAHLLRFLGDPSSRGYEVTYPAGLELCRAYVAGGGDRFRRLLREQVRVGDLLAAREAGADQPPAV